MTQGQISTETYKRGTEVQGVQILNVMCRICYNKKMFRSLARLRCRLGVMRGCDVWVDTTGDLRVITGSISVS